MSPLQKMGNLLIALLAAIVLATLPVCRAQPPQQHSIWFDRGARKMMRSRDVAFALNAAQVLAGEEQLAELALKQASDPAVKQFAGRLQAENRKIGKDLDAAAAKMRLTLPRNATEQTLSQRGRLLKLSGPKFDAAFLNDLLTNSKQNLSSYRKEAHKGKDAAMKAFAERTLPVLQSRLDAVKALKSKLKAVGV